MINNSNQQIRNHRTKNPEQHKQFKKSSLKASIFITDYHAPVQSHNSWQYGYVTKYKFIFITLTFSIAAAFYLF